MIPASVTVLAVVLCVLIASLWARLEAERARHASALAFAAEKEQWLRDSLREQDARHQAELARMQESHAQALETAQGAISGAISTAAFGGAKQEAKVIPLPPDAESRGLRRIREETIQAGMRVIQADYAEQGIPITDEEARLQAFAFVDGEPERIFPRDP